MKYSSWDIVSKAHSIFSYNETYENRKIYIVKTLFQILIFKEIS